MRPPPQDRTSTAPPTSPERGARIFVNYRREDASGYAGRLYEWLSDRFGPDRVFMDISAIEPGADFVAAIEHQVAACEVALVVIGRQWLDCAVDGQRRLDDPSDYVRLEIASALSGNVHIIPVLVEGASMPRERDLPDDLKPLARRQALEVSDVRWDFDAGRLIDTLEARLEKRLGRKDPSRRAKVSSPGRADLRHHWRLFPVRLVVGLLVLAAALLPQWYFVSRPQLVMLEDTGMFSAAPVKLGLQELVIGGPLTNSGEGLLLSHDGRTNEIVDLNIERGRLEGETLKDFYDYNPPTTPALLAYLTTDSPERAAGAPCLTFIEIRLADARKPPTALRFSQQGARGGSINRRLKMRAEDSDLLVNVSTVMPDEGARQGPGCRKLLKVGADFEAPTAGRYSVWMVAEAGAEISFSFNPVTANNSLWDGLDGLFEPFDLGDENIGPSPFRARAIDIRPLGDESSNSTLGARSLGEGEFLNVKGIMVGSDRIQVNVSGKGLVKVNGRDQVDYLDPIKAHALPAALMALLDAALIIWFMRLLFSRQQPMVR